MDLFCALFGHWPTPLATRRRDGRRLNRCWLCECRLEHRAGEWQAADATPAAAGPAERRFEPHAAVAGASR